MGAREVYLCEFERARGDEKFTQCGSNETGEDQKKKKKDLQFKILAIFYEFLNEDQKKRLRPKSFRKFDVSPKKLLKYER